LALTGVPACLLLAKFFASWFENRRWFLVLSELFSKSGKSQELQQKTLQLQALESENRRLKKLLNDAGIEY